MREIYAWMESGLLCPSSIETAAQIEASDTSSLSSTRCSKFFAMASLANFLLKECIEVLGDELLIDLKASPKMSEIDV